MSEGRHIGMVIISYNRCRDLLELLQNIATLARLELLREVVIVNNKSTDDYHEVESFVQSQPHLPLHYHVADENLGVSGGRNLAISLTTAPLLVFLDDDALFQTRDALAGIYDIFYSGGQNHRPVGIASFKVLYHSTHNMQVTAFPHKQFAARHHLSRFETYYFAGCAHAIRREVFDQVGLYPTQFFYGMEEYDLSYRALDAGFGIVYDSRVVVLHKESPEGRLPHPEKLRGMWVNKAIVAWQYLPKKYFYTTSLFWSGEFLRKTGGNINRFVAGWKAIVAIPKKWKRKPLKTETLAYLNRVKARLHY